jgi:hypothetical protein
MSMSPEAPEPLAEILREILALSNSTRTNQSEIGDGIDPIQVFDAQCVKDTSQRKGQEGSSGQRP